MQYWLGLLQENNQASHRALALNFRVWVHPPPQITEQEARADARAKLRKDIELLNSMPNYLRPDFSPQDLTRVEIAMSRIKFALMKPLWGEMSEGWGKTKEFEEWLQKGELDPPPASLKYAVEFYHLGREFKP